MFRKIINNKAWDMLAVENSGNSELVYGITNFLKSDIIDIEKFAKNYEALRAATQVFTSDIDILNSTVTPSACYFFDTLRRPMGFPLWFMAGYPDVGKWIQTKHEYAENTEPFKSIFDEFNEQAGPDDNKEIWMNTLRKIVIAYKANVAILECSL